MPKARKPATPKAAVAKTNGASVEPRAIVSSFGHDDIARRAYELFERGGAIHGRDLEHWLDAERQLLGQQ